VLGPHPAASAIATADLNGDDTPDLVIAWTRANGRGRYLQILIGQHGDADFADETARLLPQRPNQLTPIVGITPVDLDGDGDIDLSTLLRNGAAGAPMYRNVARGRLRLLPASFSGSAGGHYALVDHSATGQRDLLVVRPHEAGDPIERSVLVRDRGRPLVPLAKPDVSAQTRGRAITLSWLYIWGATSYRVYRSRAAYARGALLRTVRTTSFTDSSPHRGVVLYYQVEAGNGRGYGMASAPVHGST
jgi:hypothetical protein